MARRLFIKETQNKLVVPDGFVSLTNQGGELKTGDSKGSKPISATGEKFIATGDVYEGELVYLNTDGTVSIPGNVTDDDNKADNIIGVFLSDADDLEEVSVVTKGIISLDTFEFEPRTIYYITTDGKLTSSITPYIFGKSLSSNNIMIDISFMQSILNRYGVTPTFDRLVVKSNTDNSLDISWSSDDKIAGFSVPEFEYKEETEILSSTASISLSKLIEKVDLVSGNSYLGVIQNEDKKTAEFKFKFFGNQSRPAAEYSGLGGRYNADTGEGLFKDFDYFKGVFVELFLYSDNTWIFGPNNFLPTKKLFLVDGARRDKFGYYVNISISTRASDMAADDNLEIGQERTNTTDLRLYQSGEWTISTGYINSLIIPVYSNKSFTDNGIYFRVYQILGGAASDAVISDITQREAAEKATPEGILIYEFSSKLIGSRENVYIATLLDGDNKLSTTDSYYWQLEQDGGDNSTILYSGDLSTPRRTVNQETGLVYLQFGRVYIEV